MALDLTKLNAAITKLTTVETSVKTLLVTMSQEIKDLAAQADPAMQAKLNDFADRIDAGSQELADAVVANTPTAP